MLAVNHVLDETHVIDHFDVEDAQEVLVDLDCFLAIVNIETGRPSLSSDNHVFVSISVAKHTKEAVGVFLDEVVHVKPLLLHFGVKRLKVEGKDCTELPGTKVAAATVSPENRLVFDEFVVDFTELGEHYVHFLFVFGESGGENVLGIVENPLDVMASAAVLFDGGT